MSFTQTEITHTFLNADGTAASGSLNFTLSGRMTNGVQTIVPAVVTASLDNDGALSVTLTSNADSTTNPQSTQWRVDMNLQGLDPESFFITVPTSTSSPIDLGLLMPTTG